MEQYVSLTRAEKKVIINKVLVHWMENLFRDYAGEMLVAGTHSCEFCKIYFFRHFCKGCPINTYSIKCTRARSIYDKMFGSLGVNAKAVQNMIRLIERVSDKWLQEKEL